MRRPASLEDQLKELKGKKVEVATLHRDYTGILVGIHNGSVYSINYIVMVIRTSEKSDLIPDARTFKMVSIPIAAITGLIDHSITYFYDGKILTKSELTEHTVDFGDYQVWVDFYNKLPEDTEKE